MMDEHVFHTAVQHLVDDKLIPKIKKIIQAQNNIQKCIV
jgi:hypothetical protein